MVDSGANANLIKNFAVPKHLNVGRKCIIRLSGITDPTVPTLGKLSVKFGNYETEIHIVTDVFL